MFLNHGSTTLCDRWSLIDLLLDLRVMVQKRSLRPAHGRSEWMEMDDVTSTVFAVGLRWAELDGYAAPFCGVMLSPSQVQVPALIDDLPALAEAFAAGYCTLCGASEDSAEESDESLWVTSWEAADYLGIPEVEFEALLANGAIASELDGDERRVRLAEVAAFGARREQDDGHAMDALMAMAELIGEASAIKVA